MELIRNALETLVTEASDLGVGTYIPKLDYVPSTLEFATKYYAKNQPVLMRNAVSHWPALRKWCPEYLQRVLGEKPVHVAVTPNGYADGLARDENGVEHFVLPLDIEMTMAEFLLRLQEHAENSVHYIQFQNNNLEMNFPELLQDIDLDCLEFATKCFGRHEALNFWMGDGRAVTSMHKDPYENLYCVISGHKDFILVPPHQLPFVPHRRYPIGIYKQNELGLYIEDFVTNNRVMEQEWVAIDPLKPNYVQFPEFARCTPLHIRVNAGDLLYLPNFWFHHVRQSHGCIAINAWYDMEFDSRYAYFQMLKQLCTVTNDNHHNSIV